MATTILIVDDSAEDRLAYSRYLTGDREAAYVVREAGTGEAGLRICQEEAIDCVLLDYNLPDIDGVEFMTRMKSSLGEGAPAVVMFTGKGSEQIAANSIKSGARDYLVKGLASKDVVRAIQNAIHGALEQQREQARVLRQYAEQLARADRNKDDFLATLAHELRNPLSPIGTSMDLLQRQLPESAQVSKAGTVVKRQLEHLTHLLNDLLDVARINNGKMVLQRVDLALSEVLSRVGDQCQPMVEKAGHTLRIDQPAHAVMIHGDPVRLVQIIANVVANACKFSLVAGEIVVRAESAGGDITIRVSDKGMGLAAESLSQIFGMFSQAGDQSLNLGGLGVGLSLAKRFAEMHGGTIVAHSDGLGRGCQFVLNLPIVVGGGDVAARASADAGSVDAKRILVVDDNRDAADTLQALLELGGHTVAVAYDGIQAIAKAASVAPDIVLMDLGMPGLSGYDAIRLVRAAHTGQPMVLVALTGWGDAEARRRSSEAGFDHHLVKPFNFEAARKLLGI
jgi:signal transduction histidine kinase